MDEALGQLGQGLVRVGRKVRMEPPRAWEGPLLVGFQDRGGCWACSCILEPLLRLDGFWQGALLSGLPSADKYFAPSFPTRLPSPATNAGLF